MKLIHCTAHFPLGSSFPLHTRQSITHRKNREIKVHDTNLVVHVTKSKNLINSLTYVTGRAVAILLFVVVVLPHFAELD